MLHNAAKHARYSLAVGELIVESDIQAFANARHWVSKTREAYYQLYNFVVDHWDQLDRAGDPSYAMHG